jgi:pimeloyl-ACP methyl ester carboxylesterase
MATASANGRAIAYTDSGGDGPPLLLLHGYFLDKEMFADVAEGLPKVRIIAPDARGHGETDDDGVPFDYWDAARDVLGLMDELGVPRATVGGVSQGGFTSLRVALLAPERVESLVLFDTEAEAVSVEAKSGYHQLFDALIANGPIDELARPLALQLIGDADDLVDAWVAKWQAHPERLPLGAPVACLLERDDIADRLPTIQCPTLLVRGSEDASLPPERMELLARRLPRATSVRTVHGAAHSPPLTHPAEVCALLGEFMAGQMPVA